MNGNYSDDELRVSGIHQWRYGFFCGFLAGLVAVAVFQVLRAMPH